MKWKPTRYWKSNNAVNTFQSYYTICTTFTMFNMCNDTSEPKCFVIRNGAAAVLLLFALPCNPFVSLHQRIIVSLLCSLHLYSRDCIWQRMANNQIEKCRGYFPMKRWNWKWRWGLSFHCFFCWINCFSVWFYIIL